MAQYPTAETDPVAEADLATHAADTTAVHGIADTAALVQYADLPTRLVQLSLGDGRRLTLDPAAGRLYMIAADGTTAEMNLTDGYTLYSAAGILTAQLKAREIHFGPNVGSPDTHLVRENAGELKLNSNRVVVVDGSGKIPTADLPALAITEVYSVASQVAQLALTADEGDVAIRTDLNKSYIHNGGTAGTMADWSELLTPTDAVLSVAGRTGAVTLAESDIANLVTDLAAKLAAASNLSDVANTATARTNLGLGTAATHAHGDYDAAGAAAAAQTASQPLDSDLTAIAALSTTSFGRALLELADAAAGRTALAAAPLASPALTGTPTVPTAAQGTNTTQAASTAYVQTEAGLLVPKSLVDAKGDLIAATADNTPARLAVGADGRILEADSAQSTGLKWGVKGSRKNGQSGMYGTPQGMFPNAQAVITGNRLYLVRFVPTEDMTIVSGAFGVAVASSVDDQVDIGIYDAGGNKLKSAGATSGKLNSSGRKILSLTSSLALTAGTIYYSAFMGAVGGTAAQVSLVTLGNASCAALFETAEGGTATLGLGEAIFVTGAGGTLPSTVSSPSPISNVPAIAWRTF